MSDTRELEARLRELDADGRGFITSVDPPMTIFGEAADALAAMRWQPIETAPKGGGADLVTDPQWVRPPKILLRFGDEAVSVAYWDWYYAEGGNDYRNGFAWIEPCSGESLDLHYTTAPTHWMPLPAAPKE